jgi:NADH dehydrogenase (ubiquinone) 1 alpha subcomplex subunit 6
MTTIPARLAQTSRTSSSLSDARSRAIQLYREWYRSVRSCLSHVRENPNILGLDKQM